MIIDAELIAQNRAFEGVQKRFKHFSTVLNCDMTFSVYEPPQVSEQQDALLWLSGLTCNDLNFVQKAGSQALAAQLGMVVVSCDTSPRGEDVADDDAYDLGQGAGFYVDATESPWSKHFKMYSYVVDEMIPFIQTHYSKGKKVAIAGHSMGGHGALMIGLRNPELFSSISAFAPISNPMQCEWGQKAFSAYLGENKQAWARYDAMALLEELGTDIPPLLIDQGMADEFLESQKLAMPLFDFSHPSIEVKQRQGYDHSYFYIASFFQEHVEFHKGALGNIS